MNAKKILYKELSSLKPGDTLSIPWITPDHKKELVYKSVVLRLDEEGKYYLSALSTPLPTFLLWGSSPFTWNKEKKVLLDSEGKVPDWYSDRILVSREDSLHIVKMYEEIPRSSGEFIDPTKLLEEFSTTKLGLILSRLVVSNESGSDLEKLSLALTKIGIDYNEEQLVALFHFMSFWFKDRSRQIHLIKERQAKAIKEKSKKKSYEGDFFLNNEGNDTKH